MTDPEYVLTIRQPWASAIFTRYGWKNIENRTWKTNYRGRLWIHTGGREDTTAPRWAWELVGGRGNVPLSAFTGHVTITACLHDSDVVSRWAWPGYWHWFFADPVPLAKPVPYTGQRALWPLPDELRKRLT